MRGIHALPHQRPVLQLTFVVGEGGVLTGRGHGPRTTPFGTKCYAFSEGRGKIILAQ
jgi:hypothetical protein